MPGGGNSNQGMTKGDGAIRTIPQTIGKIFQVGRDTSPGRTSSSVRRWISSRFAPASNRWPFAHRVSGDRAWRSSKLRRMPLEPEVQKGMMVSPCKGGALQSRLKAAGPKLVSFYGTSRSFRCFQDLMPQVIQSLELPFPEVNLVQSGAALFLQHAEPLGAGGFSFQQKPHIGLYL